MFEPEFDFDQRKRRVQSIRVVPTPFPHGDYPGAYLIMFGPSDEGPTDLYDLAPILFPSEIDLGLAASVVWHPRERGLVINGFTNKRVIDQQGASTLLMYIPVRDANREGTKVEVTEGTQEPMGVVTPLGDGSFQIDLYGNFFFHVEQPNEYLHPNSREPWRDQSWKEYLAENPICPPTDSKWNRFRDYWMWWFIHTRLYETYLDYVRDPLHEWWIRRMNRLEESSVA